LLHDQVKECVLRLLEASDNDKQIIAYFTAHQKLSGKVLSEYMSSNLPSYMIPSRFVQLESFPLTTNGKIDHKKLPGLDQIKEDQPTTYEAPQTSTEIVMTEIWENVLSLDQIGIHDNFFDIGGHSLKAIQLITKLQSRFDVKIELKDVFTLSTIHQLSDFIDKKEKSYIETISLIEEQEYYKISNAQNRLWILSEFGNGESAYNITRAYLIRNLSESSFCSAFQELIQRHEVLRTVFLVIDGEPKQKVNSPHTYKIETQDLRKDPKKMDVVQKLADLEATIPFDLSEGPMLRVKLLQIDDNQHALLLTFHHIVTDAQSEEIMMKELLRLYDNYSTDKQGLDIPTPPIQYKDYSAWQNREIKNGSLKVHGQYWSDMFGRGVPNLDLPIDFPRKKVRTFNGGYLELTLNQESSAGIRDLNDQNEVTLFMTFLSIINVFLYKYTDQDDIVIGTPVSNRNSKILEDQLGFYINLLPLRNRLDGAKSFIDFLQNVKEQTLESFKHQLYPFDLIVQSLTGKRDISRHPIFDVLINVRLGNRIQEEQKHCSDDATSLMVEPFLSDKGSDTKLDLRFVLLEHENEMNILIHYNSDLFKVESIKIMRERLEDLIFDIVSNPYEQIDSLSFKSEIEKEIEVDKFNLDFNF
ncbi:MAG: condensation domain-containing protein, partial [Bacteroidota bacterium]